MYKTHQLIIKENLLSMKDFREIRAIFAFLLVSLLFIIPNCYQASSVNDDSNIENVLVNIRGASDVPDLTTYSIENETLLVHDMSVIVRLDNSLKIESTFVLTNNGTESLNYFVYIIKKNISSVFSYDPIGLLLFSWEVDTTIGNIINVTMRYPLLKDEIYVFSISYEIEDVVYHVEQPEEYYGLDFDLKHTRITNRFNLEISLPMYSELLEQSLPAPVYPTPNKISTEDNIVKITWNVDNRDLDDDDVFLVRYTLTASIISEPKVELLPLYLVLTFLAGAIIAASIFFILYKYKFKPVESGLVSSLLSDTEQEVIKAINSDGGVSTQRRICDKTGYSKSKVSQILSKLEEKEVLKRERWGRTNKVTITKTSFKSVGHVPEGPPEKEE